MNNSDFRKLVQNTEPGLHLGATEPKDVEARTNGLSSSLGTRHRLGAVMPPRSIKSPVAFSKSPVLPKNLKHQKWSHKQKEKRIIRNHSAKSDSKPRQIVDAFHKQSQIDSADHTYVSDGKELGVEQADGPIRGHDFNHTGTHTNSTDSWSEARGDADDEFEKLGKTEVVPIGREKVSKRGSLAAPSQSTSMTKRSRNDILAELKASHREADKAVNSRNTHFKKVMEVSSRRSLTIDETGREILTTVDENGCVKRKVRKLKPPATNNGDRPVAIQGSRKPLGLEMTEMKTDTASHQNEDIFEGVGDDYDPLDGESLSDSSSDDGVARGEGIASGSAQVKGHASTKDSLNSNQDRRLDYFAHSHATADNTYGDRSTRERTLFDSLERTTMFIGVKDYSSTTTRTQADLPKPTSTLQRLSRRDRDLDDIDMSFGDGFSDDEDARTLVKPRVTRKAAKRGDHGDKL